MNTIHHSITLYNCFKKLRLTFFLSDIYIKHLMAIICAVFCTRYKGKTIHFSQCSNHHRTTIAHFLNHGKWDSDQLRDTLKGHIIDVIYGEAERTNQPVYLLVDDTIASHTKPSSKALHPIEDAYFHQSHLKGKQDYGHQVVGILLSCNGITLNYDTIMYDKSMSKIDLVLSAIEELPVSPVVSYFLCDSWYTSAKFFVPLIRKGFYLIGAVKTNRILYPKGIKASILQFSMFLCKHDENVSLVTVGKRQFYVYRYQGKLNDMEDAVVLITYPKEAFLYPRTLRAFLSTDTSLSTEEILSHYVNRWKIELFFREAKQKLALDKYQIRSSRGIKRYWLIMSLTHFICCTCSEYGVCRFEEGYQYFCHHLNEERLRYVYDSGKKGIPFEEIFSTVA